MHVNVSTAALDECVVPLAEESRRALRRYWEQVIREEWVPPARRDPVPASAMESRRRREARRAMARVAAAGGLAAVVSLPTSTPTPTSMSVGSGVAGSGVAA